MSKEGEPPPESFSAAEDTHRPREGIDSSQPTTERHISPGEVLDDVIEGIKSGQLMQAWAALPYMERERKRVMIALFSEACAALQIGGDIEGYVLTSPAPAVTWKRGQVYDQPETMQEFMEVREKIIATAEIINAEDLLQDRHL